MHIPGFFDLIIFHLPTIIVVIVTALFIYALTKEKLVMTSEKYDDQVEQLKQQNESALKQVEMLKQQNQDILNELESLKRPKKPKDDEWFLD
ncbi:hypothetical protein [Alkalibacillus aidingensis]|uniref:hypothetical protein n=1 Tax=Alkalibacillus aidingensis TaxID=2747607 RepID=UPI0016603A18|nr:hypothetical protein [Alkalibacillus aidingensis]